MNAIELAEQSAWTELNQLLLDEPRQAELVDDYGMLPLHWACTDPSVTDEVVHTLLTLHPNGAQTKNGAGLLPLHIAIKAEIDIPIVEMLLASYPAGLNERTPHGDTPGDIASKLGSPPELCSVLQIEYTMSRKMSEESMLSKSRSSSCSLGVQMPPRWQHVKACHVCQAKFGPFRSRHHCRGCGISVCNSHSRGRMALPHLGLHTLQRVCAACYEEFNPEGPRLGSNTLTSSRNMRRIRSQTEDFLKSNAGASPVINAKALARLRDVESFSDFARPSRTSSESSHDIDLLQESIQTLNRTKALLQEQIASSQTDNPINVDRTRRSLQQSPKALLDVAQTQHLLGVALAEQGNNSSAIVELRKSLAMKTNPTVMYDLGKTLYTSGDLDGAETVLREALTLVPDDRKQKILTFLGKVLYGKGDSDAAIEVFQQALSYLSHGDDSSEEEDVGAATAEF